MSSSLSLCNDTSYITHLALLAVEETSTDSADSDASGSQTSAGTDKVIQKRRYSASEDELLIKLRTQSYPPPWKDLARQFDNRTVRCLTTRWDDFLKPRVQKVQRSFRALFLVTFRIIN